MSGKGGSRPTVSKRAKTADQKAAVALRSLATRADELADRLEYGTELPPSELTGVFAELRVLADRDWSEHPCGATFELANGEHVTPCVLRPGHPGQHEGRCLGSPCLWPRGYSSEEQLARGWEPDTEDREDGS